MLVFHDGILEGEQTEIPAPYDVPTGPKDLEFGRKFVGKFVYISRHSLFSFVQQHTVFWAEITSVLSAYRKGPRLHKCQSGRTGHVEPGSDSQRNSDSVVPGI